MPFDARHEKTDLKVFVIVILTEGLVGWGPANRSLGYDNDYKILLYWLHRLYSVVGVIQCHDNDKDLKVCFLVMCVLYGRPFQFHLPQ